MLVLMCSNISSRVGFGFCLSKSAALMIWPDWQYPHCGTRSAIHAFCTGWLESAERPSIVVMDLPATSDTWVWQENARLPSMCTMHAPHSPAPQPNLVPVSLRSSLITHKRGVVDGAAEEAGFPLIVKLTDMFASPDEFLQSIALNDPKSRWSRRAKSPREIQQNHRLPCCCRAPVRDY